MKTIITTVLLGISLLVSGQKLDITIIGTAHYFKDDYQQLQDFETVQNFITQLNPDIICIEAIPIDDTLSLIEIWPNTMKRADKLKDTLENITFDSEQVMIGSQYFSSYDFWNGYYQWFQALDEGDSLGYFGKFYPDQSKSEFGLIIFPAAGQLGKEKLYGIDYRANEKEFMKSSNKVMKKLIFNFKWKPLRTYIKVQKSYKQAEKNGKLIAFINGDEFQNAFPKLIEDLPRRLPKSEDAHFIRDHWLQRNEEMANRIIKTAQAENANNILLTVGSAHVTHIRRFLEAKGHQVTTYGQILNAKNQ